MSKKEEVKKEREESVEENCRDWDKQETKPEERKGEEQQSENEEMIASKEEEFPVKWVYRRNIDVISHFLKIGYQPDPPIQHFSIRDSPFMIACALGFLDVATLLFEKGAKVDWRGSQRKTALIKACEEGHFDVCQFLIDKPNCFHEEDFESLLSSATNHGVPFLRLLLGNGVKPENLPGFIALRVAAQKQSFEITEFLLTHGATPLHHKNISSPLHLAVGQNCLGIAKLLLQHNANVNALNETRRTPLAIAVRIGSTELIKLLLQHDAATDLPDKQNLLPIHRALKRVEFEAAQLILEKDPGVGVNGFYPFAQMKMTPLQYAVKINSYDFVQLLLENGASQEPTTDQLKFWIEKRSPMELCKRKEMRLLLLSFMVDVKPAKKGERREEERQG